MITKEKIIAILENNQKACSLDGAICDVGVFGEDYSQVAEDILDLIPKKAKGKKEFVPPTLEEFIKYFAENGFNAELATRAWKGYDAANWHDSKGNPIRNWKQKCQHVWFSDNNERYRIKGVAHKNDDSIPNVDE